MVQNYGEKETEFLAIGVTFRQALVIWCVVLTKMSSVIFAVLCFMTCIFKKCQNVGHEKEM
jgi:hypothetical protein